MSQVGGGICAKENIAMLQRLLSQMSAGADAHQSTRVGVG